jgi:K+ transporter
MNAPVVSVIMNCLNSSRDLREAMDSLMAQTFTDFEVIFWDNCSTDASPAIAQSYGEKVRYFRGQSIVPLGEGRNLALAQARGKYLAFLDCDDLWRSAKLERQVALFEANPRVGLVCTDTEIFDGRRVLKRLFAETSPARGMDAQQVTFQNIIKTLGLVFGDIGTSPIYTLAVIFLLTERTEAHFIGILSLIIWTLLLLVTVGYAWLAMSLSKGGEGGTIVLLSILRPLLRSGRKLGLASVLAYVGISLLMGDGVITPAISILSAVEGLKLVPGLEHISRWAIICIALLITVVLFAVQKKGSGAVSVVFGPVMVT